MAGEPPGARRARRNGGRRPAAGSTWSERHRGGGRLGPSGGVEELLLQHATELLRPPVLHEELQTGLVPRTAIAVLAEQRRDGRPDLGAARRLHERPSRCAPIGLVDSPPTHRSNPAELGMNHADERDVVDLGIRATTGQPLIEVLYFLGRFENAVVR